METPIIAPPYHVQSTAAELRSGFPYFSYHDSVSALWLLNGVQYASTAFIRSQTPMSWTSILSLMRL